MNAPILQPVVALIIWSLVMLVWMVVARVSGMKNVDPAIANKRGMRGVDLDGAVPGPVQWPAHNYNHLMEQPTLFYAVALTLAVLGAGDGLSAQLAWVYTGSRVVHSLLQATVNIVMVRFLLWLVGSGILMALAYRAASLVF